MCTIREFPRSAQSTAGGFFDILFGVLTLGVYNVVDGIHMLASGEKSWGDQLADAIKKDMQAEKPKSDTIASLSGSKNGNALNKPVPFILGKHKFTPYYIGMPYTEISGNYGETQYYNILFLVGYKDLQLNNLKLGTIDLASNSDNVMNGEIEVDSPIYSSDDYDFTIEVQNGENPEREDGEVGLYHEKVVQEDLSLEVMNVEGHQATVTRFSAKNPRKVQIEITFAGLIGYDDSNNPKNASCDLKLEWSKDGGTTWNIFGQITGCQNYDSTTGVSHFEMKKAETMRFVAEKTFTYNEVMDSTSIQHGRTLELRISRVDEQSVDSNVQDKAYVSAIRTWCFDYTASLGNGSTLIPQVPMIQSMRDRTCRVAIRCKASEYLTGQLEEFNLIAQSLARTYDDENGWSEEEEVTNNPASLVLKCLKSEMRGNNVYPDSKIDYVALGELYNECENKGYKYNGVVISEIETDKLVKQILAVARSSLIMNGKKYSVFQDKAIDVSPVLIINNQNLIALECSKDFTDLPDGIKYKFVNEKDDYQQNEIEVYYETNPSLRPQNPNFISKDIVGITDASQLYKFGRYELAKLKLRPETWVARVTSEGNLCEIGSLVEVQSDTISIGSGDGAEIVDFVYSGNYITKIVTDGMFDVTDLTKEYGIKILVADGIHEPQIITKKVNFSETGVYSEFTLDEPIYTGGTSAIPTAGDILSFGIYDKISTVNIVVGKKEDEEGHFDLTLVPYDENIYSADSGTIPEFDSKVTNTHDMAVEQIEPPVATKLELLEKVSEIVTGEGLKVGNPATPTNVSAIAEKDRIRLSATVTGSGLANTIAEFQWQYKKASSDEWTDLSTDHYYFNRITDGYLEASDFETWFFRVRAKNTSGKLSNWQNTAVNTNTYGTWLLSDTQIDIPRQLDRTIILSMRQSAMSNPKERYGSVKYRVEISRYDDLDENDNRIWYKPATTSNPYDSENNYKDGVGYVLSDNNYVQIVPLEGQSNNHILNTLYYYRITAILVDTNINNPVDIGTSVIKEAIALCTNIRDIINADETAKEELNVKKLSAISANLGEITDGALKGNSQNYWTLTTDSSAEESESKYAGAFRVGGLDQYFKVTPIVENGVPVRYEINLKVGNFEASAETTSMTNVIYLYDDNDYSTHGHEGIEPYHTKRSILSVDGIIMQSNSGTSDEGGIWSDIGRFTVDKNGNLFITNASLDNSDVPKIRTYIDGVVYHLDNNFLTDKGESEEDTEIEGALISDSSVPIMEVSNNILYGSITRQIINNEEFFYFFKGDLNLTLGGNEVVKSGYTLKQYKDNLTTHSTLFAYKE